MEMTTTADTSMLLNRLRKNLRRLKGMLREHHCNAFRLYDRDIPEYPYIIDCYADWVLVYEKGSREVEPETRKRHQDEVRLCLLEALPINPNHLIFKERKVQTRTDHYQAQEYKDRQAQVRPEMTMIMVHEGPAKFRVNLWDYIDTGLFIDHRPLRRLVYGESSQKKVLNLFSYTGAISVMAALGGAREVVSVDLSSTYQDWAVENFRINEIDVNKHRWITQDAIYFLKEASKRNIELFDLIIVDPPTFSNSKKLENDFDIERDHIEMIKNCMNLLRPDGKLYFSTPFRKFRMDEELKSLFKIGDITKESIPKDCHDPKIHHCFSIEK